MSAVGALFIASPPWSWARRTTNASKRCSTIPARGGVHSGTRRMSHADARHSSHADDRAAVGVVQHRHPRAPSVSGQGRSARWRPPSATTGAILGAIDLVQVEKGMKIRDITVSCIDAAHGERVVDAVRGIDGVDGGERPGPHLPDAPGRQDPGQRERPGEDARRPLDGLYAGRRAHLHRRSTTTSRAGMVADRQRQHRSPWSPTGRPCSASATSAPRRRCR